MVKPDRSQTSSILPAASQFFSSLRFRLLVLVLLGVIPAVALILFSAAEQRRFATAEVQGGALRLARQVAADHRLLVEETRQLLVTLSYLPVAGAGTEPGCTQVFAELLSQYPQYSNLGLAGPDGRVLCSGSRQVQEHSQVAVSFIQRALDERKFISSGYQLASQTSQPTLYFSLPVFDEADNIQTVLFAALKLEWLKKLASAAQLPEDAVMLVVDSKGQVLVYHPEVAGFSGMRPEDSQLIRTMLSNREGTFQGAGLDGAERLYGFTRLQEWENGGIFAGVGVSQAAAFARVEEAMFRSLGGLGIVVGLAMAAAWVGGDLFVVRRVKLLVRTARRLADGDLAARTGLKYGQGEISQLARTFDQMGAVLEQREIERKSAEIEIQRHLRDLSALNTITAAVSSSLDILEVLESLKRLLSEQFQVPGGVIFLYDELNHVLRLEAAWGVPAAVLATFKEIPAASFHYQRVLELRTTSQHPNLLEVEPYASSGLGSSRPHLQGYLCIPLLAKGQIQGVIDLFSQAPETFTAGQVNLFATLGQEVGVAVQNARFFAEVNASRERLRMLSQQLIEVQENERRHIARELHDEIGQALTAVKVNLQTVSRLAPEPDLLPHMRESIGIIDRTIHQVRNLSLDLRPSLLDDLGIVSALRWYIDRQAQRAGIEAFFTARPPDMRFSPALETTCFRVVQEALTNVIRHAEAHRVSITIEQGAHDLNVTVRDDGIGFDVGAVREQLPGDATLGLMGMKERVELVGGSIEIISGRASGTEIRACLPLE